MMTLFLSLILPCQDEAQYRRLTAYLNSIDVSLVVHCATSENGTPWHISPHEKGAPYMQCVTFKSSSQELYTVISEHQNGSKYVMFSTATMVLPKVRWVKTYVEMAGGPPVETEPKPLAVLASRALDASGVSGLNPESTGYRAPESLPWLCAGKTCSQCERVKCFVARDFGEWAVRWY